MSITNDRLLDLPAILRNKSCILFGPRQTGKTRLVSQRWPIPRRVLDLQNPEVFLQFSRNPDHALRDYVASSCTTPGTVVIIDDIHRLPALLDAAYRLIEEGRTRFLFVTSSRQKLLRNGGHIRDDLTETRFLHPLSAREIGPGFNVQQALTNGLLPEYYHQPRNSDLSFATYVNLFLQEEILPRDGTRNLPAFLSLLTAMARHNGDLINYAELAAQTRLPRTTVQEYVQTIVATGMAYELPAWTKTSRRKAIRTSKLYLFDMGVTAYLQQSQSPLTPRPAGTATPFQHWVLHELRCFVDALPPGASLAYWRSTNGFEVDFVLNDKTAIAAHGTSQVGNAALKGLRKLREEGTLQKYLLVCCEPEEREVDGITILPWQAFVTRLWAGGLCT
jgi:predicted AAA+ superfamily ATPase